MKKPTIRLIALNLAIALLLSLCAPVLAVSNLIPGTIYIDGPAGTETRFTYTPTARWHNVGGGTPVTLQLYKDGTMLYEMHEGYSRWIQLEPGNTYELVCINEYSRTNCFDFLAHEDVGADIVIDRRGDYCFTPEETAYYQFLLEDGSVYPWASMDDRTTGHSVEAEDERFFLQKGVDYTFRWVQEYPVRITKVMTNELNCTQSAYEAGTYLFKPEESGYYSFSHMPQADISGCGILSGSYVYYLNEGESYRFVLDEPFTFTKLAQPLTFTLGRNSLSTFRAPQSEVTFTPQDSGCYSFLIDSGVLRIYDGEKCIAHQYSRNTAYVSLTAHKEYSIRMEPSEILDVTISKAEEPLILQAGTIEQSGMYIPKATGVYLLTGACTVESLSTSEYPLILGDNTTYAYLTDHQIYNIYDIPSNGSVNVQYLGEAEEIYADGVEKPEGFYWFTSEQTGFYALNEAFVHAWDENGFPEDSIYTVLPLEDGDSVLVAGKTGLAITEMGNFDYTDLPDGTIAIRGICPGQSNIVIPASIDGKTVSTVESLTQPLEPIVDVLSITFPDTVTYITEDIESQSGFSSLQNFYIGEGNPVYATEEGVLFNKDKTCLISFPSGRDQSFVVPTGVTEIADNAFGLCKLESVTIPEGVTTIPQEAFRNCWELVYVSLPETVTGIEAMAFACCEKLTIINLPSNLEYIGRSAFEDCASLREIHIPSGVSEIPYGAFARCKSLEKVTIPYGVTTIGGHAFVFCENLKTVTIPAGVTNIGYEAFADLPNLDHVHFLGDMPQIDVSAFIYSDSTSKLYYLEDRSGWDKAPGYFPVAPWNYSLDTDCNSFIYTCADCMDMIYQWDENAHDWYLTDDIALAPTCTEEGMGSYCCRDCGKIKSDSIPALGHAQGELIQETDTYWEYACLNGDHTFTVEKEPRLQVMTLNGVQVQISDGPEYPWVLSENTEYEGGAALISTNQGVGNSMSTICFSFSSDRSFVISYDYGVSSEQSYDYLSVLVDDIFLGNISGEENMTYETEILSPGTHTLKFTYIKDGSVNSRNDTAYIFNIVAEIYEGGCTHSTLYEVKGYAVTCTDPGRTDYWYCEECRCYFFDQEAQLEISYDETIVPALGLSHNYCYYSNLGENHLVACCNCGDSYQEDHTFTLGECTCGKIPDSPVIPDGYVAIYNPAYGKAMTTVAYSRLGSSNGVTYTQILPTDASVAEGKLVSDSFSLALFKVITNEEGITSFQTEDGKYLEASRYVLQFVDEPNVNTEFVLEPAGEGYFVRLANDFSYGDYSYLEYYQGSSGTEYFTTYPKTNSGEMFLMSFLEVAEAPACDHVWVDRETLSPTCTNDGYKVSACTLCSGTSAEVIAPLGHHYIYKDNGAHHTMLCSRCSDTHTEEHTYEDGRCIYCSKDPVKPDVPEGYVAIYCPGYALAVTTTINTRGYLTSAAATIKDGKLVTGATDVALVKILTDDRGITSFQLEDGRYLEANYPKFSFTDTPNENTEFILDPVEGGYYIRHANFLYNGTIPQYIEYYPGADAFTIYGMGSNAAQYVYNFYEVHTHSWNEEVTIPATCTNPGKKTITCSDCGMSKTEIIPALGGTHSYEDGRCINCGKEQAKPDDLEGYVAIYCPGYGLAVTTTINTRGYLASAAATIEDGKLVTEATDVALVKILTDDRGITSFQLEDGRYLEAGYPDLGGYPRISFTDTPNEYTEFILDPVEGGYYIRLANYLYNGTKPQYIEYYPGADAFTIWSLGSDAAQYVYNFYEAHIHTWNEEVTVPATCTDPGEKTITCAGCGASRTETIPALGGEHSYADGRCINCGMELVKPDVPDGYVAIYCPGGQGALSTTITAKGHLASAAATIKDGKLVTGATDVALVKVLTDERGITSFQLEDGRYLEAVYPRFSFTDTPNENTEFILETVEGGYYIRLANYLYNETTPEYIKYYPTADTFRMYAMDVDTAAYVYNFYEAHIHTWDKEEVTTPAIGWMPGEKTITCTGCGKSKTEIIPAEPTSGDWVIAAKVGDTYYAMSNTFGSKNDAVEIPVVNGMVSASDAEGFVVTLSQTEAGWTISSADAYLTYYSGNNFGTSTEPYYWDIIEGTNGSWRICNGVGGKRAVIYRGGSYQHFGTFVASNATETSLEYYDIEILPIAREEKPVVDEGITIGHSLNLASDISVNFAVKTTDLENYVNHYMKIEIPVYNGNEQTGTRTETIHPVLKGDCYYYTLTGITAVNMGTEVNAQLHMEKDGHPYVSKVDTYSIAQYAYAQLNKPAANAKLKALCAELLRYGKEAQVFKSHRTDALVDAAMTEAHRAYLSDAEAVVFNKNNETLNDLENPAIIWLGKSLNLESKVAVKYIFDLGSYTGSPEDLSMKVRYVKRTGDPVEVTLTGAEAYDAANNRYAFSFDGLLAAELRTVVEVAIYAGETQLSQTVRYSADTYGNGRTGQLLVLCKALFAYSDTAKAYFAS